MSELPAGWVEARLDEITHIILGQSPPGSSYNKDGIGLPFFQGKAEFGELRPAILKWTTDPRKTAKSGDILLSVRAPVGPTNVAPCDCAIGRGLAAIRPLGGIDPIYVRHALRATEAALVGRATGTTFDAVNGNQVREHHLPVAPLAEQRRIVAAIEEQLSRLDAAASAAARARGRLTRLRNGIITDLVGSGWPRVPWHEVGRSQNGRAFPSRDYVGEGVRLLRPGNLHASGRVVWADSNTRHLASRYAVDYPDFIVGPNELVMNLTAQSLRDEFLGRVCVTGPSERCLLNQRIARLGSDKVDVKFLLYVFKSRPFRRFVDSLNTGSLIQHMFTSQLDEFEVPLPPLAEQRRVVAEAERQLSVIDAMESTLDAVAARYVALRQSILREAFAGRLVPQDPSDEPASALLERIRAERAAAGPPRRRSSVRSSHQPEERIVSRAGGEYDDG